MRFLERRLHTGVLILMMQLGVLVRHLRGERPGRLASAESRRLREWFDWFDTFQNRDGSWLFGAPRLMSRPTLLGPDRPGGFGLA